MPCAAAGIDVGLRTLGRPASAAYLRHLELFDVLAPRSALDVKTARTLGLDPFYGADWALRLVTDAATDLAVTPRHVALVLREFPLERVSYAYIEALERLVAGLAAMGRAPFPAVLSRGRALPGRARAGRGWPRSSATGGIRAA